MPARSAAGHQKGIVGKSLPASGRPGAFVVGKWRIIAKPFAKMADSQPRFIAGRIGQNRATGQRTRYVAHIQSAVQGQRGTGVFNGVGLRGRAKQGNKALQPIRKTTPPACFFRQMRKLEVGVGIDTGRGQTHRPHIAHQRACGQTHLRPGQHVFHQAIAYKQHAVVDLFQRGKQACGAGRALTGKGQNAFGPDGQQTVS